MTAKRDIVVIECMRCRGVDERCIGARSHIIAEQHLRLSHARLPRCHEFAHDPHDGLIASRDHRRHGVDETRLDDARSFYREGVEARLDDEARQRLRQADI